MNSLRLSNNIVYYCQFWRMSAVDLFFKVSLKIIQACSDFLNQLREVLGAFILYLLVLSADFRCLTIFFRRIFF